MPWRRVPPARGPPEGDEIDLRGGFTEVRFLVRCTRTWVGPGPRIDPIRRCPLDRTESRRSRAVPVRRRLAGLRTPRGSIPRARRGRHRRDALLVGLMTGTGHDPEEGLRSRTDLRVRALRPAGPVPRHGAGPEPRRARGRDGEDAVRDFNMVAADSSGDVLYVNGSHPARPEAERLQAADGLTLARLERDDPWSGSPRRRLLPGGCRTATTILPSRPLRPNSIRRPIRSPGSVKGNRSKDTVRAWHLRRLLEEEAARRRARRSSSMRR